MFLGHRVATRQILPVATAEKIRRNYRVERGRTPKIAERAVANMIPTATAQAAPAQTETRAETKRHATLQAQLALRGFVLRKLATGEFIVTRWGLCRELADIDAVARFTALVGAA